MSWSVKSTVSIMGLHTLILSRRGRNSGKPVWHHLADIPGVKIRHYRLSYVLVPVFLMVVGALVIKQPWFREEAKPVAVEDKPPVVMEEKAPVVDKANDGGPQPDEVSGKQGLKPNCDEELRRIPDLLKFFANRIQAGEEAQSVVGDMRQQEKRIAAACPN